MHTTRSKPDWQYSSGRNLTRWQSVAMTTRGIITPGNLLSVSGLILVIFGSIRLYQGAELVGMLSIIIGRLMDLGDGWIAESTHTKSPLGEIIDTTCDKLSVAIVVTAAYSAGLLPIGLFILVFLHHGFLAVFSLLFAKRYNIHPTRLGKLAMFASWVVIVATIYDLLIKNSYFDIFVIAITVGYGVFAIAACLSYYRVLQQKILQRMRSARWTRNIEAIVFVHNNRASNSHRAKRWNERLTNQLNKDCTEIPLNQMDQQLIPLLRSITGSSKKVLLTIAGGDGSVSSVVNHLLQNDDAILKQVYILPLWGGNANDFAYMLNGLSSQNTVHRLLALSSDIEIPPIKVELRSDDETTVKYACSYASFGATAFTARRLNQTRLADKRSMHTLPFVMLFGEILSALKAMGQAPMFKANIEGQQKNLYEHSFINGSRMAKVNWVPINLNEPAFFHAVVDQKSPSLLIELVRIITKRVNKQYVKRSSMKFIVEDDVDLQIDGEVFPVKQGTHVLVTSHPQKLRCISTRLEK